MTNIDKLKEEVREILLAGICSGGEIYGAERAIDHLASQGRILQDGFVAVPVEPTEKMIAQGMMHIDHTNMSKALPHVYKAMIAAQEGKE